MFAPDCVVSHNDFETFILFTIDEAERDWKALHAKLSDGIKTFFLSYTFLPFEKLYEL